MRCPFCPANIAVTARSTSVLFDHAQPPCGAWDRVCYVGGFSEAERDAFDAFIRGFEPGGNVIQGPWES